MYKYHSIFYLFLLLPFISFGQQKYGLEVDTLITKADSLYYEQQDEASEQYFLKAEKILAEKFTKAQESGTNNEIVATGFMYADYLRRYRKKAQETITVVTQILETAKKLQDTLAISDSYYMLGASHYQLDEIVKSYQNLNNGLLLLDKEKYPFKTWKFYRFMADVLKGTDKQKAIQNLRLAIQHFSDKNTDKDKGEIYHTYMNLLPASQLDSIEYYAKLYEDHVPASESYESIIFYNDLAYRYIENGLYQKAKDLLYKKLQWCNFDESFEICPEPITIHTLGVIDKELGDYDAGIRKFEFSLSEFIYFSDYKSIIEVSEDLSEVYEKKGQFQKSLAILKPVQAYRDSLEIVNLKKEIEKIETRKLLSEKEEVIEDLKEENQEITVSMSKLSLTAYLLAAFILILILFFGYRSVREKVKIHKLNEKIQRSRLQSLTEMMNPHFLFNCFSTLQNFILNSYTLKANEYMAELSILIRNILSASDSVYITFEKELTILKSYCTLESVRFENKFRTKFIIDDALNDKNFLIPSMVIQPFIENAFKHAFTEEGKEYLLTITFEKTINEYLSCRITDNGIGRDKAATQKETSQAAHLSIATGNVDERLQLINTMEKRKTKVTIDDLKDNEGNSLGTEIILLLPTMQSAQNLKNYA